MNLKMIGKQKIAGIEFTGIEGGFGEDKRAMLVAEIAKIHSKEIKHINLRINENRKRFKNGKDIIDLKSGPFTGPQLLNLGYTAMQIAKATHIYALSERGYAKLLKILEDDKAWELYDLLVDEYFQMRAQINQQPNSIETALQAALNHERKIRTIETDVSYLKDNMRIDGVQQQKIQQSAKSVVVKALGGTDSLAYSELSKKAFSAFWREFKNHFNVPRYGDIQKIKYDEAIEFTQFWRPSTSLQIEINQSNNQMNFLEGRGAL